MNNKETWIAALLIVLLVLILYNSYTIEILQYFFDTPQINQEAVQLLLAVLLLLFIRLILYLLSN
jgi:Na+-driven multidrug efflux pump